ncbi:MAG: arylesterase, partial [Verrucomicrobiota bacterium]
AASLLRGAAPSAPDPSRTLLVLGDSLGAGYGVEPGEGWPARLQHRIDTARLPFRVVNASVSGDTTAGGLRRLEWPLKRRVDVLLVELGGNDGLRGLSPAATRSNLTSILQRTRAAWPEAALVVAGMQMPPNMGPEYEAAFQRVFPEVAQQQKATLVPHLLEGVGGVPEMNQPDLIHPTAAGHDLVASNVWTAVEPLLRRLAPPPAQP